MRGLSSRALCVVNAFIDAVFLRERFVRAALHDATLIHDNNLVGIHDGRDAVGDQNRCAAHVFVDGFANLRVGFHIHGGKRVIENFDRRVLHEHTGDGDALFLTAGDRHAALADLRIVAFGKAVDGVVDDGKAGILAHAFNIVAIGTVRNGVLKAL